MTIDPIRTAYINDVHALVREALGLPEAEFLAQERVWIVGIENGAFSSKNFSKILRSAQAPGYKARLIAIALAPEGLMPFVWKDKVPSIDIGKYIEYFPPRLQNYVRRIQQFNASFSSVCV